MDDKIKWIVKKHFDINQKYDGLPYIVHLQGVSNVAKKYLYLIPEQHHDKVIKSAWGHDLLEDPLTNYNEVKRVLGIEIADIIYRVSNEKGKNRKERANDKYYAGIKECEFALFVKLADRISNMIYSKTYGNYRMFKTYKDEYPEFRNKLYNGKYDEMWAELEDITVNTDNTYFSIRYKDIDKFTKDNVHLIKLPKPIPAELYKELFNKGIIRKKDLVIGKYYYGKCRNSRVAVWNGNTFVYMKHEFKFIFPENINHLEDDNGFDVFIPIEMVEPNEKEIVIYK